MAFGKPKNPLLEAPEKPPDEEDYLVDQMELRIIKPGGKRMVCGCIVGHLHSRTVTRRCSMHTRRGWEEP